MITQTTNHVKAEQSVLATLLSVDNKLDVISNIITVDDFSSDTHKDIYQAITDLAGKNKPQDTVTVSELMQLRGQIGSNKCNDGYFARLMQWPTLIDNSLIAHAELVKSRSLRRRSITIMHQNIQSLEDGEDTQEVNNRLVTALSDIEVASDVQEVFGFHSIIGGLVDRMQAEKNGDIDPFYSTGFGDLDNLIKIKAGDLMIIAGRPSMGKTLLSMNIQTHFAKTHDGEAVFFSLEMGVDRVTNRLVSSQANIHLSRLEDTRLMTEDDHANFFRFVSDQKDMRLTVVRKTLPSIGYIRTQLNRIKREKGKISSIGVDYLQLMEGMAGDDSVKKIGIVTSQLKAMGAEFECPVFLLSQLNRKVEERPNKRPMNSDLRESGRIEEDADIIAMCYREDSYKVQSGDKELDGMADIIIGKNRNGSLGDVRLVFEGGYGRFASLMAN